MYTAQRGERQTEAGIHHWFRTLKAQATKDEWELINDVTYHELRHTYLARAKQDRTCCPKCGHRLDEIEPETACADSVSPDAK